MKMNKYSNDIKLNVHPLLKIVEEEFMYFAVSLNMMCLQSFQNALVKIHNGKMSEMNTSVAVNEFKVLRYDVAYVLNSFNKRNKISFNKNEAEGNIMEPMIRHSRLLTVLLYDLLFDKNYYNKINKTEIFKFVKHLRNGSAHNNKFNFEGKAIKEVEWRGKIIKECEEGKQVFGRFIYLPDLLILVNDISDKLDEIDKKGNK
jgi:hypothetical protein